MSPALVQFQINTPGTSESIAANIAHACSLGLPEADQGERKTITVIANGPSGRHIDLAKIEGDTLALNGALGLFTKKGLAPTYWAACDPQALVADFLTEPPLHTIYLVASKCDPLIFEMLKGRDVRLWHINDHQVPGKRYQVPCASSVTLTAISLLARMGYQRFEVWGWDACYGEDGSHHANDDQPHQASSMSVLVGAKPIANPAPALSFHQRKTVREAQELQAKADAKYKRAKIPQLTQHYEGGRSFNTTTTWAAEAQDAATQLRFAGYEVNVHGDGMIAAVMEWRNDV